VLVTTYRDFVLVSRTSEGKVVKLENYVLAKKESDFWNATAHPHKAATRHAGPLIEYLKRVMRHPAPLTEPKDVAWFLASYARDALGRIEHASLPALDALRGALEEALGLKFEGEKGERVMRCGGLGVLPSKVLLDGVCVAVEVGEGGWIEAPVLYEVECGSPARPLVPVCAPCQEGIICGTFAKTLRNVVLQGGL